MENGLIGVRDQSIPDLLPNTRAAGTQQSKVKKFKSCGATLWYKNSDLKLCLYLALPIPELWFFLGNSGGGI